MMVFDLAHHSHRNAIETVDGPTGHKSTVLAVQLLDDDLSTDAVGELKRMNCAHEVQPLADIIKKYRSFTLAQTVGLVNGEVRNDTR